MLAIFLTAGVLGLFGIAFLFWASQFLVKSIKGED